MVKINEPKRILIVRTDRIGDVVLSTPVIENLRLRFPDAYIAFMCRPLTYEVVEGNPYLNEVIVYDKYGKHKSWISSLIFSRQLRAKDFHWAIILHPTNRAHLLTFLARIPVRVGWDKKMKFLLTKAIVHNKQEGKKHELEYTLDILRSLGIPILSKSTYFPVKKEAESFIEEYLYKEGVGSEDLFIVVHPSASCVSKRWPSQYFLTLIRMLIHHLKAKVAVVTSKEEVVYGEAIVKGERKVIDLRGKLTLSQLASLLKRADLFISNDSGPVHIAASLGTPVISIFGRNEKGLSPPRWRPLGERSFYLHKDVGCQRCLAHSCPKDYLCLKAITPKEVFTLAKKILQPLYLEKVKV